MALLEADVNLRVVRRFVNATIEEAKGEKVLRSVDPGQQFVKIVHDRMVALLGDERQDLRLKGPDTQSVILFWDCRVRKDDERGKTRCTIEGRPETASCRL